VVALSLFDKSGKKSPTGGKLLVHKYGGRHFLSDVQIVFAAMMVVVSFAGVGAWSSITSRQKQKEDELERHCITPDQLSQALARDPNLPLFDLREPLDVLVNSEMIPGAWRMCPHRVLENPWLLPRKKPAVIYCTSPSGETSRAIVERALALGFLDVKLLKGGLHAWKAKGYAVEPYFGHTRLDVAS
jgi:rhodanese-related sulfurtransferase